MLRLHSPLVVILNFQYQHRESLADCAIAKKLAPGAAILVIASAGPAVKAVRSWAKESQSVDVVIEKPLSDERFFLVLRDLVEARQTSIQLQTRARQLENLLPSDAVAAIDQKRSEEAEMFQATVLFTDIRRSTDSITQLSPAAFFALLNRSLSAQSVQINAFQGVVIKYTGDGVFAVFRGMGHSFLALRSAIALAQSENQNLLPFGVGVAEGLVLAGFIGDSNKAGLRRQYDVIGATVNLAARLCSTAKSGEVVTTAQVQRAARVMSPPARDVGVINVRGFDAGVSCVAFGSDARNAAPD